MTEHQVSNFAEYRGDELKLARMVVGFSCEELVEKIGKTKQFISKLEKGCRPSEQCLELISSALMTKSGSLFTGRKYVLKSDVCYFQSRKSRTQTLINSVLARAEILNIIISAVEGEIESPDVSMPEHPGAELPTPDDIERTAGDCRRARSLGLGPISSMIKLVESLGVIVAHITRINNRVDASTVRNNRPAIIRNSVKKSIYRFRSDLGHELGHLVMHEDITAGDKLTESQADHFSGALLIPRLFSTKEFPWIRDKQFDWNTLVELKLRWKISLKVCIYRVSTLSLLTQEQIRIGYMYLNSKGCTKVEPGDELLCPERPGMLVEATEIPDDATWLGVPMKISLSQNLIRKLFSINRPITNPGNIFQIV